MNKQLLHDYKKWLLYSFDNQPFENYYNLFKALESKDTVGSVRVSKSMNPEQQYIVSLDHIGEDLQLTEKQRGEFLKYLSDNYFKTEDIDDVMKEKTRQSDRARNHNYIQPKNEMFKDEKGPFQVKPHPKETTYFNIKLIVSILVYVSIAGMAVYATLLDLSFLFSLLVIIPLILIVLLFNRIIMGIFIGIVRGNSVRVTKEQFPDLYTIVEEQARQLKMNVPEIYIRSGDFNAFATKFSRAHIILIQSSIVETALKGNYDVLKYVTAHELCHLKQRHITKKKWLFPSAIIPFLGLAYSRGCEYTCDRVGYDMSPRGSVEGILMMTTGKEIHSKFNIELHIQNSVENEGFWTWFSEKFLTHPHLYKRLVEIKKYSEYN